MSLGLVIWDWSFGMSCSYFKFFDLKELQDIIRRISWEETVSWYPKNTGFELNPAPSHQVPCFSSFPHLKGYN